MGGGCRAQDTCREGGGLEGAHNSQKESGCCLLPFSDIMEVIFCNFSFTPEISSFEQNYRLCWVKIGKNTLTLKINRMELGLNRMEECHCSFTYSSSGRLVVELAVEVVVFSQVIVVCGGRSTFVASIFSFIIIIMFRVMRKRSVVCITDYTNRFNEVRFKIHS